MDPAGASGPLVAGQPAQVAALGEFLDGVQTTEGRLVLTGAVVLGTLALVAVIVPWLARRLGESTEDAESGGSETAEAVRSAVRVLFLRGLQLGLVLSAGFALLVVWDRIGDVAALLPQGEQSVEIALKITTTVVIVVIAYVVMDALDATIARFSRGADRITDHQEEIIRRVGQLAVIALVIATGLTVWGVNLSGLLVGAGFLGIVVGLAARQTLGSMIAGFVLMFSRPFTIGDWVEIGDEEGIVTDITIVNTRLENFDGEFVVIPNDMVGNQPITNRSQKGHLRIRLDVGVDYGSDPDHAREVALDAMQDVAAIEQTPPPQAFLKAFGDSAVVIELRFWIDRPTPPRKWQATNAIVEAVKTAFDEEGIKIPFPQRELSGRAETGGFQVRSEVVGRDGANGAGRDPESGRPGPDGQRDGQSSTRPGETAEPADADDEAEENEAPQSDAED